MCLTRIYCRRRRDGTLFRFNSKVAMVNYSRAMHETRHTLPMIDRQQFINEKKGLENPTWIRSQQHEGMAMLTDQPPIW